MRHLRSFVFALLLALAVGACKTSQQPDQPATGLTIRPPQPTTGQQVRLLKAQAKLAAAQRPAVPKKLSKGAVYAPAAQRVGTGYKSAGVLVGDSSTLTDQSGAGVAQAVSGDNNKLDGKNTAPEALSPLAVVAQQLTGPIGYILAAGLAAFLVWLFFSLRAKKRAAALVQTATKFI